MKNNEEQHQAEVYASIIAGLNNMAKSAHSYSAGNGFWEGKHKFRDIPEKLALIHSEVSEALEAIRDNKKFHEDESSDARIFSLLDGHVLENGKPVGFPSELADIIIRVGDLAAGYGIDLGKAVVQKMEYNKTRPYKHGKAF